MEYDEKHERWIEIELEQRQTASVKKMKRLKWSMAKKAVCFDRRPTEASVVVSCRTVYGLIESGRKGFTFVRVSSFEAQAPHDVAISPLYGNFPQIRSEAALRSSHSLAHSCKACLSLDPSQRTRALTETQDRQMRLLRERRFSRTLFAVK